MSTDKGVIDIDKIENSLLRAGVTYWRRLRGSRAYPSRQDLSPRDISALLRNVILVRVLEDGADFEFRIVGDAHVQIGGFNMQGGRMRDLARVAPRFAEVLRDLYGRLLKTRTPFALRGVIARDGSMPIASETVLLPLGPDDTTIDHILVLTVYNSEKGSS